MLLDELKAMEARLTFNVEDRDQFGRDRVSLTRDDAMLIAAGLPKLLALADAGTAWIAAHRNCDMLAVEARCMDLFEAIDALETP